MIPKDMLGQLKESMSDFEKQQMIRKLQVQTNIVHYTFIKKPGEPIEVRTRSLNPELALNELKKWSKEVKKENESD